jgi:hypothetical protein
LQKPLLAAKIDSFALICEIAKQDGSNQKTFLTTSRPYFSLDRRRLMGASHLVEIIAILETKKGTLNPIKTLRFLKTL